MFPWDLDFFVSSKSSLKPFQSINQCSFCNYTPQNKKSNSTPRDLVLSFASKALCNVALFVRTLRSTHCQSSLVILLDRDLINTLKQSEKILLYSCRCQIIPVNTENRPEKFIKNFLFQLSESFLRINQRMIDRVIICDLFDAVFQGDPFHEYFPKNMVHFIDENATFRASYPNIKMMNDIEPNFTLTDEQLDSKYYCSGYMGAYVSQMIVFLDVFLQGVSSDHWLDQGIFNLAYLKGDFDKAGLRVGSAKPYEFVAHMVLIGDRGKEFPYVPICDDPQVPALILHHTYMASPVFFKSLIRACPRPDTTFHDYLTKIDDSELVKIENAILKEATK